MMTFCKNTRNEKEEGCVTSAGFLHCRNCGLKNMDDNSLDPIVNKIQEMEDVRILEQMKNKLK